MTLPLEGPGYTTPGKAGGDLGCFFEDCKDCTEPCKEHGLSQSWEPVLEGHVCPQGCYDGCK